LFGGGPGVFSNNFDGGKLGDALCAAALKHIDLDLDNLNLDLDNIEIDNLNLEDLDLNLDHINLDLE
jgi:hypothetical protein